MVNGSQEHRSEYQHQPPYAGLAPEVLAQVEIGHVLVDKTERVCLG